MKAHLLISVVENFILLSTIFALVSFVPASAANLFVILGGIFTSTFLNMIVNPGAVLEIRQSRSARSRA